MAAPAAALMDELIEECLLRLPSDDPANFVRAALVSKGWRRIIADRAFGRRFRELHGRPSVLGFLHIQTRYGSLFTPTSSSRLHDVSAYLRLGGWHAIDSRHGRVLLSRSPSLYGTNNLRTCSDLAVWDPVSGDHLDLPKLPPPQRRFVFNSKAAVLCASSSACDHFDCHRGHFLVVLMDTTYHEVDVYVYSSQSGAWSHQTSASHYDNRGTGCLVHRQPVTMAGNALYFIVHSDATNGILKYDMSAHEVSRVDLPLDFPSASYQISLTTTEHGGLGIARMEVNTRLLHLWSREADPNGVFRWAPSEVIELEAVLPPNACSSISTVSFVHGLCAFIIMTNGGAFAVDLLSNRVMRVASGNSHVNYLVPYTGFCTPGLYADNEKEMWVDSANLMLKIAMEVSAKQTSRQINHLRLQDPSADQEDDQDED